MSQDIQIFVLTFWSCRKTAWLEQYGKFAMSQPGKETIAVHILPISQEVKASRPWNLVS